MEDSDYMPTIDDVVKGIWSEVRQERDVRLAETDVVINTLEDAGKDTTLWRRYRQALRDIPQSCDMPWDLTWPTKPTN